MHNPCGNGELVRGDRGGGMGIFVIVTTIQIKQKKVSETISFPLSHLIL